MATATTKSSDATQASGAEVDVLDATGKKSGTVVLPAEVFDVQTNVPLIHQVVVAQLAAARQGTHSTKSRGEVRGGGAKPHKQKGTGRARQGSTRAPQFAGGGVVHGPTPRDYTQRTPKKMKAAALRGALSDRARHGRVHVVSSLVTGDSPSTGDAVKALANIATRKNVLVVLDRRDEVAWKSLRNADRVHLLVSDQLNTYDVLCSDDIVFTEDALRAFLTGPTTGRGAKAVASESEVDSQVDSQGDQQVEAAEPSEAVSTTKTPKAEAKAEEGDK
jgi:large subunit ribosomal protein L4